jgi:hypothetical protein
MTLAIGHRENGVIILDALRAILTGTSCNVGRKSKDKIAELASI